MTSPDPSLSPTPGQDDLNEDAVRRAFAAMAIDPYFDYEHGVEGLRRAIREYLTAVPPAGLDQEKLAEALYDDAAQQGWADANELVRRHWLGKASWMIQRAGVPPAGLSEESLNTEAALALVYARGWQLSAPRAVAAVCDEELDPSGALLGRVRDLARLASGTKAEQ